jgi:pyrroloquinoline quinone biosynthesis protein B
MRVRILGAAAGGGLPQWNCGCANCDAARSGRLAPRTQDSVLVQSAAGDAYLLNASPDVLVQFARTRELAPRGLRRTPLVAVVLTSGDLDHCVGLLSLREEQAFFVYATAEVQAELRERNVIFRALDRSGAVWRTLEPDRTIALPAAEGGASGIELTPFAVSGKLPRHLEGTRPARAGDQIGVSLRDGGETLVYASTAASLAGLSPWVRDARAILFDGTFFENDELVRLGIGRRSAFDMAHLPVGGKDGSLATFPRSFARRIYTHVNNTNPMLQEGSPERSAVEAAGWEVAHDGMEVLS